MNEQYIHKDNMLHEVSSKKSAGDKFDKYPECEALFQNDCICGN